VEIQFIQVLVVVKSKKKIDKQTAEESERFQHGHIGSHHSHIDKLEVGIFVCVYDTLFRICLVACLQSLNVRFFSKRESIFLCDGWTNLNVILQMCFKGQNTSVIEARTMWTRHT
jgi:hypothetical protein